MMGERSMNTPCDVPEKYLYLYSSKLRLIVSKGGANSADLDSLGLYF